MGNGIDPGHSASNGCTRTTDRPGPKVAGGPVLKYPCIGPCGRPQYGDVDQPAGYRQLADLLRRRITDGVYAPGQRLPSESALAQTYGLSPVTVRRAVTVLRTEGLIDVRQGYPSRVREVGDMVDVDLPPTRVGGRMPTPADRAQWSDIPDGCPMLVALDVLDEHGRPKAWPAHRYRLRPG